MARGKKKNWLSPKQWLDLADQGFISVGRAAGVVGRRLEAASIGALLDAGQGVGRPKAKPDRPKAAAAEKQRKPRPRPRPKPDRKRVEQPVEAAAAVPTEAPSQAAAAADTPRPRPWWKRLLDRTKRKAKEPAGDDRPAAGDRPRDSKRRGEAPVKPVGRGQQKQPGAPAGAAPKGDRSASDKASKEPEDKAPSRKEIEAELNRLLRKIRGMIEASGELDETGKLRVAVAIEQLLLGSESARAPAKKELLEIGGKVEPFLLEALSAPDADCLELALDILWEVGSGRLTPSLDRLAASPRREIRLAALRAAQRLKDDEARPFLTAAARDSSVEVRRRAVSYLSWRGKVQWALSSLRGLCDDAEPSVKLAALEALAASAPDEARELLDRPGGVGDGAQRRRLEAILDRQASAEQPAPAGPAPLAEEAPVEPDALASLAAIVSAPPDDEPEKASTPDALASLAAIVADASQAGPERGGAPPGDGPAASGTAEGEPRSEPAEIDRSDALAALAAIVTGGTDGQSGEGSAADRSAGGDGTSSRESK